MRKKWVLIGLGLGVLVLLIALWHYQPWQLIGPRGYWQIQLRMTEPQIAEILGRPSTDYRPARHIGGMTSPGVAEVLFLESGLPFGDLPTRYGEKSKNGQEVHIRQWWGTDYGIDVAFDSDGYAVGVYLMKFRLVNFY
jgi:hypothetical protein